MLHQAKMSDMNYQKKVKQYQQTLKHSNPNPNLLCPNPHTISRHKTKNKSILVIKIESDS